MGRNSSNNILHYSLVIQTFFVINDLNRSYEWSSGPVEQQLSSVGIYRAWDDNFINILRKQEFSKLNLTQLHIQEKEYSINRFNRLKIFKFLYTTYHPWLPNKTPFYWEVNVSRWNKTKRLKEILYKNLQIW